MIVGRRDDFVEGGVAVRVAFDFKHRGKIVGRDGVVSIVFGDLNHARDSTRKDDDCAIMEGKDEQSIKMTPASLLVTGRHRDQLRKRFEKSLSA
jgi:hypothetical protein